MRKRLVQVVETYLIEEENAPMAVDNTSKNLKPKIPKTNIPRWCIDCQKWVLHYGHHMKNKHDAEYRVKLLERLKRAREAKYVRETNPPQA